MNEQRLADQSVWNKNYNEVHVLSELLENREQTKFECLMWTYMFVFLERNW